jgi:hypothetical protein
MRVPASDWMERSALRRRRALRSAAGALNCNDTSDALGSGAEEAQYLSSLGAPTSREPCWGGSIPLPFPLQIGLPIGVPATDR